MIRFDRLTVKSQEALAEAQRIAERAGHQQIDVEHLALALVRQKDGLTPGLLNKLGTDPTIIAGELEQELKRVPQVSGSGAGQVTITSRLNDVFSGAEQEAEHGSSQVARQFRTGPLHRPHPRTPSPGRY